MDIGVRASTLVDWINVLLWNHMKKSTGYNSHDGGGDTNASAWVYNNNNHNK